MWPFEIGISPLIAFNIVDFPEPDDPDIAYFLFFSILTFKLSKTILPSRSIVTD